MSEVITQIRCLQLASGSINKMHILRKFQGNEDFRKFLYYTLNSLLTYKVSEDTLRRLIPSARQIHEYKNIFDVCECLSKCKALNDEIIYKVCSFLRVQDNEAQKIYIKLLAKTLRLGVTAKTVNKVIPNLIPEWDVQQAYSIDKYPLKENTEFWLTQKLNGVRATYYKGRMYARSGIPYEGLDHILDALCLDKEDSYVFDGELTLQDSGGLSDNEAFRKATGIINSDGVDKTGICYTIFDMLPTWEFEHGESEASYSTRRKALSRIQMTLGSDSPVSILPVLYHGTDQSKIDELLNQMVREDKEGLMLNLDVPYKCKRHSGILKVKRFYTMDLPIIACEEGRGRLSGALGAFVLDYKGNEVRVGSGFTDEQRAEFWDNKDALLGVLCEVKYKEISFDKATGANSLQFPVFICLRTDKEGESYY